MIKEYTYQLDKSSKKHKCPCCGQKRFVLYVSTTTNEYLHESVGRCDREDSCRHIYTPKQYFIDNNIDQERFPFPNAKMKETGNVGTAVEFLPFNLMDLSVEQHRRCCLYPFLQRIFQQPVADFVCNNYFVGTNRAGNTVYWQVDRNGDVRQAKVMLYNSMTGHRNKDAGVFFAGKKILNNPDANLQQCFFGEFLLSLPENLGKPVAIVESEKSCLISSIYYPDFIWLATGGKNGAKWTDKDVCKVLRGKRVILFPDLGAHDLWTTKGKLLANIAGCTVVVSDILEQFATDEERAKGLDIADYLLREQDSTGLALTDYRYPVIWDYRIDKSRELNVPEEMFSNSNNNNQN